MPTKKKKKKKIIIIITTTTTTTTTTTIIIPYTTDKGAEKVIDKIEIEAKSLFKWFSDNQMKANPDKCNSLISSTSKSEIEMGNITIKSSICEKLLGIKLVTN